MQAFSVRHRDTLRELFGILGVSFSETDTVANAKAANEAWFNEHGKLNRIYTDDQLLQALRLGPDLGMVGENLPPAGTVVTRMNNPGGTLKAMVKRVRLYLRLEEAGELVGPLVNWAGQRLRDLKRGETLPELRKYAETTNPKIVNNDWYNDQLKLDDTNLDRYQRPFATETEVLWLVCLVEIADLQFKHIVPIKETSTIEGVPAREAHYYMFSRPGKPGVIILNGAAVRRFDPNGNEMEPRPKTDSTAKEIAKLFGFDGRQGFMVSNPHSERLAREAVTKLTTEGFNPDFVVYGLPGPDAATLEAQLLLAKTMLGEVARLLNFDRKMLEVN